MRRRDTDWLRKHGLRSQYEAALEYDYLKGHDALVRNLWKRAMMGVVVSVLVDLLLGWVLARSGWPHAPYLYAVVAASIAVLVTAIYYALSHAYFKRQVRRLKAEWDDGLEYARHVWDTVLPSTPPQVNPHHTTRAQMGL